MGKNIIDLGGVLIFHAISVFVLGALAMFTWNVGAVLLLPDRLSPIAYMSSVAIITGIYIADLFVKSYMNKLLKHYRQKHEFDLIFKSHMDKKDGNIEE